jgi:hypothetical protein
VISDFRRDLNEIFALLGRYTVCSGKSIPKFRSNLSVPLKMVSIAYPKGGTERFPRNLGNELLLHAA